MSICMEQRPVASPFPQNGIFTGILSLKSKLPLAITAVGKWWPVVHLRYWVLRKTFSAEDGGEWLPVKVPEEDGPLIWLALSSWRAKAGEWRQLNKVKESSTFPQKQHMKWQNWLWNYITSRGREGGREAYFSKTNLWGGKIIWEPHQTLYWEFCGSPSSSVSL